MSFLKVRKFPSVFSFLRIFYEWLLNLVHCFLCNYSQDHIAFFPFFLLKWWLILGDFPMLNQVCTPRINHFLYIAGFKWFANCSKFFIYVHEAYLLIIFLECILIGINIIPNISWEVFLLSLFSELFLL